jgi:DNA polymerase (family 10)
MIQELLQLEGVTPKMAEQLENQGVKTLDELEKRLKSGQIKNKQLESSLQKISRKRFSLRLATQISNPIISRLRSTKFVKHAEFVGSVRREKLHVANVNILFACQHEYQDLIFQDVAKLGEVASRKSNMLTLLKKERDNVISIEMRAVEEHEWIPALFYFTGSSPFIARIREIAQANKVVFSSSLIKKEDQVVECKSEEDIFKLLGEEYVSPYLRVS